MPNAPMSCWNWRWAVLRLPPCRAPSTRLRSGHRRPGCGRENPRVVFLLGLVEGEFPSAAMPGGLFSEEERERMARGGLPFIVEGDRSAATERMFCYRAATAATERLYAFYPATDAVGERLAPSELFVRAAALSAPWEEEPLWEGADPRLHRDGAGRMRLPRPRRGTTGRGARSRRGGSSERNAADGWEAAAEKRGHKIGDEALARRLFGMRMRLSPTRLEQFYRCPFSYYMNKGLGAKARQRAEAFPGAGGHPDSPGAGAVGRALRRRGTFHRSRAGAARRDRPADRRIPHRTARGFVTGAPAAGGRLPPHWRLAL